MNKAPLRNSSFAHRAGDGPGKLTLAWLALGVTVLAAAAAVQLVDWSDKEDIIIALDGEPERFARPVQDGLPLRLGDAGDAEAPAAEAATGLPSVRAALPGEFGDDDAAPATAPLGATMAAEPDAAVIRIEDLPRAGEPAAASRTVRVAGTAPPAADPALYRQTDTGPLPRPAADGRKPARYYARTFAATEGAPRIGLIVSGLGLSSGLTGSAISDLPAEVTLAFAPYARNLDRLSRAANEAGHELMIEVPMEAGGVEADRLGPAGLLTAYSAADNLTRLDWILSRYAGYFGVTNYLGGAFSANAPAMQPVIGRLRDAGVAYISDAPVNTDLSLAGVPHAQVDFLIAGERDDLAADLGRLEEVAKNRGRALAKIYVTEDNLPPR